MTTIYLIRHAEAEGNRYRRAHGWYNSTITDRGYHQIAALAKRFADTKFDAVYSSDRFRTMITALAIYKTHGLPLRTVRALREIDVGYWEDTPWAELERTDPEQLAYFSNDSQKWHVDGCESFAEVRERMRKALTEIAEKRLTAIREFAEFNAAGGTLFLDERCSIDAENPTANWLIYGHNMADGSMFGELTRYREEDFYKEHPTFTFDTIYETGTWQVVAALDTTLGDDALPYYTFFDADTPSEWQKRVDAILDLALYDTGVTPEYGQQLLTLSTCGATTPSTDTRFALLAVRVD